MKVAIFGSHGFLGSAVTNEMVLAGHDVCLDVEEGTLKRIDLLNIDLIRSFLRDNSPDAVINCAGIIDASGELDNNVVFTQNILTAIHELLLTPKIVLITGSAGEYGVVDSLPVSETATLNGVSPYALSKIHEEEAALRLSNTYGIPAVVARVFNVIGSGMKAKFLIPSLIMQIEKYQKNEQDSIQLSRLDSMRDFVDVRDVAKAYRMLIEAKPLQKVYNVGSGVATSNKTLLETLLQYSKVSHMPKVMEQNNTVEPQFASQADITRINLEFGWQAEKKLDETIKDIIDASE